MENWLLEVEKEWNIEILFACEAGSRAWGTDSIDSDYDLRFIYRHQEIRSYLSLKQSFEVLDFNEPYDAHGWDIFKALELTAKSNPSIYEWAFSPIVYVDKRGFSIRLQETIMENFSPFRIVKHYLSLISRNLKELNGKQTFNTKHQKSLIQVLRASLIIRNIIDSKGVYKSPYFNLKEEEGSMELYKDSYMQLVQAKKNGYIVEHRKLQEILSQLVKNNESLIYQSQQLPKGKDFKDELDIWLWEILRV